MEKSSVIEYPFQYQIIQFLEQIFSFGLLHIILIFRYRDVDRSLQ